MGLCLTRHLQDWTSGPRRQQPCPRASDWNDRIHFTKYRPQLKNSTPTSTPPTKAQMTDTDAKEKANEGEQGLTLKGCGIECRCLSMPCVNGLRHRMPLPSEVEAGPNAAKGEDHSSSDRITLTGLPTAWEGDSVVCEDLPKEDEVEDQRCSNAR